VNNPGGRISQVGPNNTACPAGSPTAVFPSVAVTDDHDAGRAITVTVNWSGPVSGSAPMNWDGNYYGTVGNFSWTTTPTAGGTLKIWVTATDSKKHTSSIDGLPVTILRCDVIS
jgi:hypothetical protein